MLQQSSVYQVFVRNYAPQRPLQALTADLQRIQEMGFDYLYLMPIHPISKVNRKGSLGSPYSIADYYEIDEALGDRQDFENLISKAHQLGLKVLMDMVFNHTGGDHGYLETNPDFYWRNEQGELTFRIGDWSDIVDLDFSNPALQKELINVLEYWAASGVDGYRFDVASLIPMAFWVRAKTQLSQSFPHLLWVAESIELNFHRYLLKQGIMVENIAALAEVFDVFYDYETWDLLVEAFGSIEGLKRYAWASNRQFLMQPQQTLLWRFLENHDQPRIAQRVKDVETWLYFNFLSYGMAFVYQGQEWGETHRTSLFDLDLIEPRVSKYADLISNLNQLKKRIYAHPVMGYEMSVVQGIWRIEITTTEATYWVVLNPFEKEGVVDLDINEGLDLVRNQRLVLVDKPISTQKLPMVLQKLA